jgi:hypothetical protein
VREELLAELFSLGDRIFKAGVAMTDTLSVQGNDHSIELLLRIIVDVPMPRQAVRPNAPILCVLRVDDDAEVRSSVIQTVAVDVIDFDIGPDVEDHPVHQNPLPVDLRHSVAISFSPSVRLNARDVLGAKNTQFSFK